MDQILVDASDACFEDGMIYVALSRAKQLSNVHLIGLDPCSIMCKRKAVAEYNKLRASVGLPPYSVFNQLPEEFAQMKKTVVKAPLIIDIIEPPLKKQKLMNTKSKTSTVSVNTNDGTNTEFKCLKLLNNDFVSCYANSVLHILLPITTLHNKVMNYTGNNAFCNEVHQLFNLYSSQSNQVTTLSHLRSLVGDPFNQRAQQDAHEFFSTFINKLDEVIACRNLFEFVVSTRVFCRERNHLIRETPSAGMEIILAPPDGPCTFSSLFREQISMSFCNECQQQSLVVEQNTYDFSVNDQHYLVVMLQLFDDNVQRKCNRAISGFNANKVSIGGKNYKCVGAILHSGNSPQSGHYTCLVRCSDNRWIHINDLNYDDIQYRTRFVPSLKDVYLLFLQKL